MLDRVSGSDSFQVRAGPRRRRCSNSSSNQWHTSGNKYLLTAGFHCQIQISFQKIMQRIIASIQIPFCAAWNFDDYTTCIILFGSLDR